MVISTGSGLAAQAATESLRGDELYEAACANCHGSDGGGVDPSNVAFTIPVPDFRQCSFSSREPDADWIAVAHGGGPVRAFDETMPAFGEALSDDQFQLIMDYIRGFCGDDRWPRGELNLPRALVTEKAYPEDEAVWTVGADIEGPAAITNEFVYERRFGALNQIEIKVPVGFRDRGTIDGGWVAGIGDVTVGVKRVLFHSLPSGTILSLGGEVKLPTGSETNGFGSGTAVFESYLAYGQILPNDAFVHAQAIVEIPAKSDRADSEAKWRAVLGRSWIQGQYGRTWSPMLEVLGETVFDGGEVNWDVIPQFQVTLNTRQHVMLNLGLRIPATNSATRQTRLTAYVLWDWFDGGLFDGW